MTIHEGEMTLNDGYVMVEWWFINDERWLGDD